MTGALANLHPDLLAVLTTLEARMGFQIHIDSGYRDPEHNKDVGGVEGSEHCDDPARGADVFCRRSTTRYTMLKELFALGIRRIGIGDQFLHVGIATDKPLDVAWTYYAETKKDSVTNEV